MKFISFVQCKAKIHYNKIHVLVTTWPQEQFFNPTQILTHSCILTETSQIFSSKKTCQISNLKKIAHSRDSRTFKLQLIFSSPNRLMNARYQTPLIVHVKIEELKFEEKKTLYPSFNAKLKCTIKKFTLSLPLGVMSNSLTQRQF